MIAVKIFRPANRLKAKIAAAAPLNAATALARADAGLESISQMCLGAVDAKIELLESLAKSGAADAAVATETLEAIYHNSNEIFAEAGTFGRAALSEVAHNLCTLIDRGNTTGAAFWQSILLHVSTMRILRQNHVEASSELCAQVLAGLREIARKT